MSCKSNSVQLAYHPAHLVPRGEGARRVDACPGQPVSRLSDLQAYCTLSVPFAQVFLEILNHGEKAVVYLVCSLGICLNIFEDIFLCKL